MPISIFDITEQNKPLQKELDDAILSVAKSGRYILGDTVAAFEKEFAAHNGSKFAVGVASGTDAIHLALKAAGIKAGDEVITSPFTFVATIEAIVYCQAKPVFVDIDPVTFNIDPAGIKAKITSRTKALLPVHLYGLAADMSKIMPLAQEYGLAVVEDCAQATGATSGGQKVGTFGLGAFSFFPTKNLGCFGDGGAITTDDEKIAHELKCLRNHGSHQQYHHEEIGFNSRLDALQAAVLSVKLKHIGTYLKNRQRNAALYQKELAGVKQVILPSGAGHTYNQFTLRVKDRDNLKTFLAGKGVPSMVYYPISLHLQEAYLSLGGKKGDLPASEQVQAEVLSLPIYPELPEASILEVCAAIKDFYK